jgi:hypothetical protein
MTYPTEFRNEAKTVGDSVSDNGLTPNMTHPVYSFVVNLDLTTTEVIGPVTNQLTVTVLHPDMYQSSPDLGAAQRAVRTLQRYSWFPGLLASGNLDIKDDGTITAWGAQGKYLKDTYTTGVNPLLTLTNDAPYTTP